MEAIVLAGGLGERLASLFPDLPKVLAPIEGRPFLFYLLDNLSREGITKCVLALGHRADQIQQALQDYSGKLHLVYSIEPEKLGTGGAVRLATQHCQDDTIFVMNGDTYFPTDLSSLINQVEGRNIEAALALAHVEHAGRYGSVEFDKNYYVTAFREKGSEKPGFISGGRMLARKSFLQIMTPGKNLSLENDLLAPAAGNKILSALPFPDVSFIDMGIPEDYKRACDLLSKKSTA